MGRRLQQATQAIIAHVQLHAADAAAAAAAQSQLVAAVSSGQLLVRLSVIIPSNSFLPTSCCGSLRLAARFPW
jgi:hypothetical protein